ncbi:MAG: ABC transporter substrate-binding protein [Methanobrevibacter sp.]|jgi:peptide/nickel transport system substrate-binding protein|nr:ABC transporter substrate-binding protein [Candidatus Methanovirga australis]
MKKMTIIGTVLVISVIAIGIFVAFFPESHNKSVGSLVVSIWAYGGEPSSLNSLDGWNLEQEPLIYSTLFKRNHNLGLVNDLGEKYNISDDGKTYTVDIKSGVKFHDGSNLTADDVAFTFNKAINSRSTADLTNLNDTTVVNSTEVKFILNQADSTFLSKLTMLGIVPKDKYNNETFATNPIGSGPFKFVQWDKGQQIILEKNNDYYGKKPNFNKLTVVYLQGEAALAAAQKGETDIVEIPADLVNRTVSNMHVQKYSSVDPRGIILPTAPDTGEKTSNGASIGNNVTSNLAIRKALNYGVNRDEIIKGVFYGYATKTYDGVSTLLPWHNPDSAIKDGDVNKAKDILNADGWSDTDGDGIVEKNGLKAEFDLVYLASDTQRQGIAVAVSEQAKKFGIKINPQGKSWNELSKVKYSNGAILGYGSRDPGQLKLDYYSNLSGKSNAALLNDPEVDSHINSAIVAKSEDTSYSTWKSVIWDGTTGISPQGDAPWLWIACKDYVYLVKNNLDISPGTATVPPHGGDIFGNIYDWRLT